jgi:hypothetical protein
MYHTNQVGNESPKGVQRTSSESGFDVASRPSKSTI